MVDLAAELAEHSLTLKRTLIALAWGALAVIVLTALVYAVAAGAGASAIGGALIWFFISFVLAIVIAPAFVALGLAVLRRCGPGRAPRVWVGAVTGLVLGWGELMLFSGTSPWQLAATDQLLAALHLAVPPVAGAIAGVLVGPRPTPAPEPVPGRDERAEDALLDEG